MLDDELDLCGTNTDRVHCWERSKQNFYRGSLRAGVTRARRRDTRGSRGAVTNHTLTESGGTQIKNMKGLDLDAWIAKARPRLLHPPTRLPV